MVAGEIKLGQSRPGDEKFFVPTQSRRQLIADAVSDMAVNDRPLPRLQPVQALQNVVEVGRQTLRGDALFAVGPAGRFPGRQVSQTEKSGKGIDPRAVLPGLRSEQLIDGPHFGHRKVRTDGIEEADTRFAQIGKAVKRASRTVQRPFGFFRSLFRPLLPNTRTKFLRPYSPPCAVKTLGRKLFRRIEVSVVATCSGEANIVTSRVTRIFSGGGTTTRRANEPAIPS